MGAIRLFLALVVVLDHARQLVMQPAGIEVSRYLELGMNAGFAVIFFYMISGFLISTALAEKYPPNRAGTLAFYRSRFIRIFSLYWPVLIFIFWLYGYWGWFTALSIGDKVTNVFILGMDWRIQFASYPDWHWNASPELLHPTWTLGLELAFYVLAPFILRSWKISAALLVASLVTREYFVASASFDVRWTYMFLPSNFLFFLLGHFARSMPWPSVTKPRFGAALLVCSALPLIYAEAPWDGWQFWSAILCFALALPGVFAGTKQSRFLNAMGDLSYPVYLIHILVIVEIVGMGLGKVTQSGHLFVAMLFSCAILAALLARWIFEKPAAMLMRLSLRPRNLIANKP